MHTVTHRLQVLYQVARDGAEFYESAQSDVRDPQLRSVFAELASARRQLMAVLASDLGDAGAALPAGGTWIGSLQRRYAQLRLTVSSHHDARVYLDRLLTAEARLLTCLRQTLVATSDVHLRVQLAAFLPPLHAGHERLRALRQRLAA